jgi:epoxyqueuosine reductase QueG
VRNAALVLGTRRDATAVDALTRALDDAHATVREAARWALARIAHA